MLSVWSQAPGHLICSALFAGLLLLLSAPGVRGQGVPPGCTGSAIGISLFTSAPDVHIGDTIFYSISVFNGLAGNPLSCDASNVVASITTPDGVVHPITLVRTYLTHTQSDFYNNAASYVVRAQDIRPDGTVRATAEVTAIIRQNDTPSQGGANQGVNTEVSQPCIGITVQCVPGVGESGLITFSGFVTNCGNNTLVGVTVTNQNDNGSFVVLFPTNLARGQSAPFSGSFLPLTPCTADTVTLLATGRDEFTSAPRTVTATASATCQNSRSPSIQVTKVCPTQPVSPGQPLIFSGSVSNTGNVTLTNIVVVNNQPAANTVVFTRASLAPGEVANFTGSYLAPTNCSVSDTLSATAVSRCGVGVSSTASATCAILTTPQIAVTVLCPVTPVGAGGTLIYSGTVRNTGDTTLNNVVVVRDSPPNTPVFTVASLLPGASANFTSSLIVPAGACSVTIAFSGRGTDVCAVNTVTNTVAATCAVITAPAITVTLACPVTPVATGGLITYTGTVRNSGNVTLNNVTVVNNQSVPSTVFTVASLAPGVSANFTTSFTAPADACSVSATVTGSGSDNCTQAVVNHSASATCTLVTTPRLVVTQICPPGPSGLGGLLTYSGTVSNAGNITLTNVVVTNDRTGTTAVFTAATLAPGQAANFTGSYTVPADADCSITSTLTGSGFDKCTGVRIQTTATATCPLVTAPGITVTQTCPPNPVSPGGILTYTGTVRNTGNITLTNVVVVNSEPSPNTVILTVASLAPGASANFTGSYQVPLNCCVSSSTATATGRDICTGAIVADTFTSTCTVLTVPRIVVTKVCPPTALRPGELLEYSGTVSNAGNITLVDVTIVNTQPGIGSPVLGPMSLAPGESVIYNGSYVVPFDFCGTDTITARGLDVCNLAPVVHSVTTTCLIITTPRIVVTKSCPVSPTPHLSLLIFTGTVSNAGNVTLTNVFVFNNQPSNNTPVIGPISLAPGQSVNFSGSYRTPEYCCQIVDTLTARGQGRCSGTQVSATATAICPLLNTPSIAVTMNCPTPPVPVGGLMEFTGSVSNSGDTILTNVYVVGNQPNPNTPLLGPIELAPRETKIFNGSYIVPFNTCSVSVMARGENTCAGIGTTNVASCAIATTPGISITESCPPGPVLAGSVVTFGGSVSNTGNITLANVFVFNGQPSNNTPVLGPITLAPGASAPFTGSYIATGGSNPVTNSTVVTNSNLVITTNVANVINTNLANVINTNVATVITTNNSGTVTTNAPTATSFATINSVSQAVVDRFGMGTNFSGLVYAPEDHGYGATMLYTTRKDASGTSFFDTIIPSTATTTDRFNATTRNFKALAYAAPNLSYGPLLFYYLSRDPAGLATFGTITPGGAVGVVTDRFVAGNNFDALTFAATDVGYGANLFYYLRRDATGRSFFGTINPALPGTVTDRFPVGTNVHALTFTDLVAPGYGANNFYYLRQNPGGVSTFGTIFVTGLSTATVTDRFNVGTNAAELAFTATDLGLGANLFYFLRGGGSSLTTNNVTTYTTNTVITYTTNTVPTYTTNTVTTFMTNTVINFTTNNVVRFTPTNTVTAIGADICEARNVVASADCLGPVTPGSPPPVIGSPTVVNGDFRLSFPTENGRSYTVQYKNTLDDPIWTDLQTVTGTGGILTITDANAGQRPTRFYRVKSTP